VAEARCCRNTPAIDAVSPKRTFFGVGWAPLEKGTGPLAPLKRGPPHMNVRARYLRQISGLSGTLSRNSTKLGNSWIIRRSARYEAGGGGLAAGHRWLSAGTLRRPSGGGQSDHKTPPFSVTPSWYDITEYDIRGVPGIFKTWVWRFWIMSERADLPFMWGALWRRCASAQGPVDLICSE